MNNSTTSSAYLEWVRILGNLLGGKSPLAKEIYQAMEYIFAHDVSETQLAGFIGALSAKNPPPTVIMEILEALKAHTIVLPKFPPGIDIVGTGGDGLHTANISTISAIVAAAAGVRVLKHGSRSASSLTGSADVLESLGIPLEISPEKLLACAENIGICFFFSPFAHPQLHALAPIRRQMGVRSIFNVIGPISHPLSDINAMIGCARKETMQIYAQILSQRKNTYFLVHGHDGQDEISTTTKSDLLLIRQGKIQRYELDPEYYGFSRATIRQLIGGDLAVNTHIARLVLTGQKSPYLDAVLFNAGAAIALGSSIPETQTSYTHSEMGDNFSGLQAELFSDLPAAIAEGISRARKAIDSGAAEKILKQWQDIARYS